MLFNCRLRRRLWRAALSLVLAVSSLSFVMLLLVANPPEPVLMAEWQDNMAITHIHNENTTINNQSIQSSSPIIQSVINPHNFEFLLNPTDLCRVGRPDVFLLAIVHSAPANMKRRMLIRQTWASQKYYKQVRTVTVFAMGYSEDKAVQTALRMESDTYGDIVQENFLDSYRNLTYKGVMWLRWTSTYCAHATYIMKVDDDIFVNIFNLVAHLSTIYKRNAAREKTVLCLLWTKMKVMRDERSKWYVSRTDWPDDYFTRYCSGSAYILSNDLILPMYTTSFFTKFFWVDDFYVTGLLVHPQNASYVSLASLYALKKAELRTKLVDGYAIFGHIPGSMNQRLSLWNEVLSARGLPGTLQDANDP